MRRLALSVLLVFLACQPRPQWLVLVDTDARVPQFGDRLLVDVLDPQGQLACSTCRRQLGVGGAERWPVSFGLPGDLDRAFSVRARLYRADHAGDDGLADPVYLDRTGKLPPAEGGVTRVRLSLPMDCFFVPGDPARGLTCDPRTRTPAAVPVLAVASEDEVMLRPDTWGSALEVACPPAPDGMKCIPGGAFVLGHPRGLPIGGELSSIPERLVWLRPFYLDQDEFTVGQARALMLKPPGAGIEFCTSRSELPLNCVSQSFARDEACARLGKRLPTEAEWEYAAGNLRAETRYPWGEDPDVCAKAIVGGGYVMNVPLGSCDLLTGPVEATDQRNDVTGLGVRSMGGNLSELVWGSFERYTAPCWTPDPAAGMGMLLRDPRCPRDDTKDPIQDPIRGGGWRTNGDEIRAVTRNSMDLLKGAPDLGHNDVGFRCAMDVR